MLIEKLSNKCILVQYNFNICGVITYNRLGKNNPIMKFVIHDKSIIFRSIYCSQGTIIVDLLL